MNAIELGTRLVSLCNDGKSEEAVATLYSDDIVSIEGQGTEEMPARLEGIQAVKGKNDWWFANHEVHSSVATGPFCGHRDDQFVVQFDLDVTPKEGERMQMREVALYTLKDDKIIQEEFLYLMG
ncbi:MAG: nuclear transport factor 2 family protein [Myxococcota bacterium]|nr:nuclear transport factor 2 family protein [Myxococcota bacterium]